MRATLWCLVVTGFVVIINQSYAFDGISSCKIDQKCTSTLQATNGTHTFCCDEGARLTIARTGSTLVTKCRCINFHNFVPAIPRFALPPGPRLCLKEKCGAGDKKGVANDQPVCCRAGYKMVITLVQKDGKSYDKCVCENDVVSATPAPSPLRPPPPPALFGRVP